MDQLEMDSRSRASTQVYRFRSPLHSMLKYIKQVSTLFPVASPLGIATSRMTEDQLADVQLDWVDHSPRPVVVLLDLQSLWKKEEYSAIDLLSRYLTCAFQQCETYHRPNHFRFAISIGSTFKNPLDQCRLYCPITGSTSRTESQIISQYVNIVEE